MDQGDRWNDDAYSGIFTRFGRIASLPHDPDLSVWSGSLAPRGPRAGELVVGGAGWDDDEAHGACLGEGVERLEPYPLPGDVAVESSYRRWPLDEPAVDPGRWVLFHREQYAQEGFPFEPFTPDTPTSWVPFREVQSGEAVWVPREMGYLFLGPGERHRLAPGISTGLASGRRGAPVLLRGLQEVIERDAVLGAWWGSYRLEEWRAEQVLGRQDRSLEERLFRPHLRYRFYRVASPASSHVTLVSVQGRERRATVLGIGSACRETREASFRKSIAEAVHSYRYARHLVEGLSPGEMKALEELSDFSHHAVHYTLHPDALRETVLERAGPPAGGAEPVEDLPVLLERLGPDRPVLFRSMTPPALAAEVGGWCVLKVIVPGLQPLHGDRRSAHLGGPLWAPRGLSEWERTPPHPFP